MVKPIEKMIALLSTPWNGFLFNPITLPINISFYKPDWVQKFYSNFKLTIFLPKPCCVDNGSGVSHVSLQTKEKAWIYFVIFFLSDLPIETTRILLNRSSLLNEILSSVLVTNWTLNLDFPQINHLCSDNIITKSKCSMVTTGTDTFSVIVTQSTFSSLPLAGNRTTIELCHDSLNSVKVN